MPAYASTNFSSLKHKGKNLTFKLKIFEDQKGLACTLLKVFEHTVHSAQLFIPFFFFLYGLVYTRKDNGEVYHSQ